RIRRLWTSALEINCARKIWRKLNCGSREALSSVNTRQGASSLVPYAEGPWHGVVLRRRQSDKNKK
ncbi:MAG TPA: hypothetical protein VLV49_18650, partial [Terriglobales bacterium]|nr:hypothetical protein [Terriglobales bacterium]